MQEKLEIRGEGRIRGIAPQLTNFVAIQILLTLVCAISEDFCTAVLHLGAPFDSPFKAQFETCLDFTNYRDTCKYFHSPEFFGYGFHYLYPPALAPMYRIFYSYKEHPLGFFLCFILVVFLVSGVLLGWALRKRGMPSAAAAFFIAGSLLLAYTLWFELKQANIEICVWVFVAFGVWAFCKGKGYTSAACFGIAGSMKIFPFVYFGLLLAKRRYRPIAFGALIAAVTTLVSLWLAGGRHIRSNWHQVESRIAEFRMIFILHFRPTEIGFDHSLFALYKRFSPNLPPPEILAHTLTVYLAVVALSGIVLYFLRIRRLPVINQVLCLCIASILLPPLSYEYTLIDLYVPFSLLALLAQERWTSQRKTPGIGAALICLAILLSPLSEFIYHSERFGGQIKSLVLVALMVIGLKYPFASAEIPETSPRIVAWNPVTGKEDGIESVLNYESIAAKLS